MDVDTGYPVDIAAIKSIVDDADVFIVGFTVFRERLLVDARYDLEIPPLVAVVPPVSSVEERVRFLRRARSRFPATDRILFFTWSKPVAALVRLGVWDWITQRCLASGHRTILKACDAAFAELQRLEQASAIAAVKGDGFQDLWTAGRGR